MRTFILFFLLASTAFAWPWTKGTTAPKAEIKIEREYESGNVTKETIYRSATGQASKGNNNVSGGNLLLTDTEICIGGMNIKVVLPKTVSSILLCSGIGLIVVGVLVFGWFCKSWLLAALSGVTGVGIIGLAYYPVIGGIVAGTAILAGLGYVIYACRRKYFAENTNMVYANAIAESPDSAELEVKNKLRAKAEAHVADIANEIKKIEQKRAKA